MSNENLCDLTDDCGDLSDENVDACNGTKVTDFENDDQPFGNFHQGLRLNENTSLFLHQVDQRVLKAFESSYVEESGYKYYKDLIHTPGHTKYGGKYRVYAEDGEHHSRSSSRT